jgi:hypothetical protein
MGRIFRIVAAIVVALLAIALIVISLGYYATQKEPDFYRQATQVPSPGQPTSGDDLEKAALDLHNDTHRAGRWEAIFTDEQLNGWLAVDLEEKFPGMLPKGILDPRISIQPQRAMIGCRYDEGRFQTVVSLSLELHLTDEPNTLAIRVCKVRAGALPVPVAGFLDRITTIARQGRIPLRWGQAKGDPVALVTIPVQHEEYAHRAIHLETVELREGEIYLAGRTEQPPQASSLAQVAEGDRSAENVTVQR